MHGSHSLTGLQHAMEYSALSQPVDSALGKKDSISVSDICMISRGTPPPLFDVGINVCLHP